MAKKKAARKKVRKVAAKKTRKPVRRQPKKIDALLAAVKGAERREIGGVRLEVGRHKAPQIVAIEPGHDGWVVGREPVVLIEFDFEGDTIRRLGMPEVHRHSRRVVRRANRVLTCLPLAEPVAQRSLHIGLLNNYTSAFRLRAASVSRPNRDNSGGSASISRSDVWKLTMHARKRYLPPTSALDRNASPLFSTAVSRF